MKDRTIGLWLTVAVGGAAVLLALSAAPSRHLLRSAAAEATGSTELAALPVNRWVVFAAPKDLTWRRQGHGTAVYDSKRGTVLLFGSNSHGEDWDDSVHEFDPTTKQWSTHYPPADPSTYRADANGNRIAGPSDRLLPWAMHTYDSVVYDPKLDALIVTSVTGHTPVPKNAAASAAKARIDPTWIYDLSTRQWRMLDPTGGPAPRIFAGASAYDPRRDVVVAYGGNGSGTAGMFELGPDRKIWHQVAPPRHEIHFTMDYDDRRGVLAVFGDWGDSAKVWLYQPGDAPGKMGRWDERVPEGDKCPGRQAAPVAFDKEAGVFLLVAKGVTCVYDPDVNRYTVLSDAKIPPMEQPYVMNYHMVYDERHGVFLIVTGEWNAPAVVWALKLDLAAL